MRPVGADRFAAAAAFVDSVQFTAAAPIRQDACRRGGDLRRALRAGCSVCVVLVIVFGLTDSPAAAGSDAPARSGPAFDDFDGEYPFVGHFLEVRAENGPAAGLHYLDEGPADAPPLLFVHGNPTWSFAWRNLIKAFRDRFRCIAVDHIGCGRSDKPAGFPYRLAAHRNNLQALIEHLDLRDATLIAHDWGGAIGCAAAGHLHERFSAIVLMNTAAFRSDQMPWRIAACRLPVIGPLGVRGLNGFARAAITQAVEQPLRPAVARGYLAPYGSWDDRVAIQAFVDDIPMKASHPSWDALAECERTLPNLASKRIFLPWGERDWCFTTAFRDEFVRRFPGAIVEGYADAGHYVFEDAADRLRVGLNAFLRR